MAKKSKGAKAAPKKAAKKPAKAAKKKSAKPAARKSSSKPAPKKAAKPAAKKPVAKKPARKPNAAFMAALVPSAALAEVIGNKPAARTEIIKKIWAYIHKNGLQDKTNKRMINADSKLKVLFNGRDQISMFELAKVVGSHVSK